MTPTQPTTTPDAETLAKRDATPDAITTFIEQLYTQEPELKAEGLENFDGYFVHWNEIIDCVSQAWPEPRGYAESPKELIVQLINERDAMAKVVEAWPISGDGKPIYFGNTYYVVNRRGCATEFIPDRISTKGGYDENIVTVGGSWDTVCPKDIFSTRAAALAASQGKEASK